MPEPSIHNILKKSFPKSTKEEWLRTASQELMEKKRVENLTWKVQTLDFAPYYDQSDVTNLAYLKKYHYRLPAPTAQYTRSWENVPQITVSDARASNERALQYLATGADGILFDVTYCLDCSLHHLLEKIDWSICAVSFVSADAKFVTKILAYIQQKNYDASKLRGSIFWKSLPDIGDIKIIVSSAFKSYHSLGLIIPPSSAVQEISTSLQQAVMVMDTMTDLGIEKESVFKTMSVSLSCDENFFITIAKLKAIRLLWYQLSQAFEVPHYLPEDLHIHATSEKWSDEKFQPHGNMINNTIQALAAVLGGCNSLTLIPEEENSEMMNRMARNVSNILKEESHVDKVADAMAGAYAVENIVHELSQAAWKDFQNKVRE